MLSERKHCCAQMHFTWSVYSLVINYPPPRLWGPFCQKRRPQLGCQILFVFAIAAFTCMEIAGCQGYLVALQASSPLQTCVHFHKKKKEAGAVKINQWRCVFSAISWLKVQTCSHQSVVDISLSALLQDLPILPPFRQDCLRVFVIRFCAFEDRCW